MKVAVSIPEPIFAEAEILAKLMKLSRSGIYARALEEFVSSHSHARLTEAMNAAIEAAGGDEFDPFVQQAGRRILQQSDW